MQIIPAINCSSFKRVRDLTQKAAQLPSGWAHIDVTDGRFAHNVTWGNPEELAILKREYPNLNFEVHLMVVNPEEVVKSWFTAGAKRAIVHLETIENPAFLLETADEYGGEMMLSVAPSTPVDLLLPHTNSFRYFQVLAVKPGLAGQRFMLDSLEKIRFLRQMAPDAKIEVDGGITPETARLAKIAGADMAASASYIFGSEDFKRAYEELNGSIA